MPQAATALKVQLSCRKRAKSDVKDVKDVGYVGDDGDDGDVGDVGMMD